MKEKSASGSTSILREVICPFLFLAPKCEVLLISPVGFYQPGGRIMRPA